MPETWLEAIAEQREAILAQWAHEDEVADGILSDPNMTPWGDDLGPTLPSDDPDDESWRDEPEVEW